MKIRLIFIVLVAALFGGCTPMMDEMNDLVITDTSSTVIEDTNDGSDSETGASVLDTDTVEMNTGTGTGTGTADTGTGIMAADTMTDTVTADAETNTNTDTVMDTGVEFSLDTETTTATTAEHCPGCAVLSVPFTEFGTSQIFSLKLGETTDFTGAIVYFRLKAKEAGAGEIHVTVKNGKANNWLTIAYNDVYRFSETLEWENISVNVDQYSAAETNGFDKTQVEYIEIILSAREDYDTETLNNPSVVYVDAISVKKGEDDVILEHEFARPSEIENLSASDYQPIMGSTVTHIAQ